MSTPPTGQGRRSRAPTITIDTSAIGPSSENLVQPILRPTPPELRQSASFESRESRPTSPHRISSPQHSSQPQNVLSVPVQPKKDASGVNHGVGDHPVFPNKEDLVPDPGIEADFERDYNPFAFAAGHLTKLLNPKSLGAFHAMGGLVGLEKSLRTDRNSGLSVDEQNLDGSISFEEATAAASSPASSGLGGLRTAPKPEPQISGFLSDIAVAFFPDNQSAHDIMSHDYAKRNHFKINSLMREKFRTANGFQVSTLGTVLQPVRFAGEPETYMREFHVLPKCVHDIILGSHFLRLTQTFTKFRHRVVKTLRSIPLRHRVCLTGFSQEMLSGWANGQSILALPDTGSDICLMSLRYARERGYRVDTDPKHRQMLEFVDGSTAETFGRVEGFQWEFDRSDIHVHSPEIHVLEGLQTDLLLGYEFLEDSDAFGTYEELFIDPEPHEDSVEESFGWLACAIKLASKTWDNGRNIMQKLGWKTHSRSGSEPSDLQKWHDRKPHELTTYEKSCTAANALSEPQRSQAVQEARDIWNRFWAQRPACNNDPQCSARTPCGHAGCNYIPPDTSTIEPSPTQSATGATSVHDPNPSDLTAAGAGAVPDPGPALPVSAQTANTTGTDTPSRVDPPGIATNLALHGAATASQAAPKTSADRLTVWQMTTGLVRMFAKSDN